MSAQCDFVLWAPTGIANPDISKKERKKNLGQVEIVNLI